VRTEHTNQTLNSRTLESDCAHVQTMSTEHGEEVCSSAMPREPELGADGLQDDAHDADEELRQENSFEHSEPVQFSPESLRNDLRLRALRLRRAYQPSAALFLARTLVARSSPPVVSEDLLLYVELLFEQAQHRKLILTLNQPHFQALQHVNSKSRPRFVYLRAASLFAIEQFEECLELLQQNQAFHRLRDREMRASFHLLHGKLMDVFGNPKKACLWYKRALVADPCCYEAFQRLFETNILSPQDERRLLDQLNSSKQPDLLWLLHYYGLASSTSSSSRPANSTQPESALPAESTADSAAVATAAVLGTPARCLFTPVSTAGSTQVQSDAQPVGEAPIQPRRKAEVVHSERSQRVCHTPAALSTSFGESTPTAARDTATSVIPRLSRGGGGGGGDPSRASALLAKQIDALALQHNTDFCTRQAVALFSAQHFQRTISLTTALLNKDPLSDNQILLIVHAATLTELKQHNELFYFSHRLTETHPKLAASWYAVSCYYYLIQDLENARKYFGKTTSIDPQRGEAWIGFGHVFAAEGEHDQAMAAYRTACRLLVRSHLPLLYLGMELVGEEQQRSQDCFLLSEKYIKRAIHLQPDDPLCFNELGVIFFKKKEYGKAIDIFQRLVDDGGALSLDMFGDEPSIANLRETVLFNMAHCFRKLKKFEHAIDLYKKCCSLRPHNRTTFAAMGFTYHLMGELDLAVDYYHSTLALDPSNSLAAQMLARAIEDCSGAAAQAAVVSSSLT